MLDYAEAHVLFCCSKCCIYVYNILCVNDTEKREKLVKGFFLPRNAEKLLKSDEKAKEE
ncbi:hypothetical protein CHISP_3359 [Chitinispirillum alkaliphilum]|nr:hypothetical protein CHISP_3359 [Chitinispirillum alkaliphilum]